MIVAGIPARNAATTIDLVVRRARKYVDLVIVVDDGSIDDTASISRDAGAIVTRHEKNRGYGAALKSLFEEAREVGADVMVILDSDGQHDPDEIPVVIAPVISGKADVAIGSRFIYERNNGVPKYRVIGIRILNFATGLIGPRVLDSQSGFRAYSKRALSLVDPSDDGMGAGSEILIQTYENGLGIVEVPISCHYGRGGSSQNALVHGMLVLLSLIRYTFRQRKPSSEE